MPRGGDERGVVPTVKGGFTVIKRERFNMGEQKLIPLGIFATLFVISTLSFQLLQASDDAIFYESFDESFEGSWIVSEKDEYNDCSLPLSCSDFPPPDGFS